mmetsp:Transcript_105399/g.335509  ORF Transcript_105399/g.335509 Transcript_105399/m.335509 type:complete len:203 (-) Transcript_105399:3023-3631(-)
MQMCVHSVKERLHRARLASNSSVCMKSSGGRCAEFGPLLYRASGPPATTGRTKGARGAKRYGTGGHPAEEATWCRHLPVTSLGLTTSVAAARVRDRHAIDSYALSAPSPRTNKPRQSPRRGSQTARRPRRLVPPPSPSRQAACWRSACATPAGAGLSAGAGPTQAPNLGPPASLHVPSAHWRSRRAHGWWKAPRKWRRCLGK